MSTCRVYTRCASRCAILERGSAQITLSYSELSLDRRELDIPIIFRRIMFLDSTFFSHRKDGAGGVESSVCRERESHNAGKFGNKFLATSVRTMMHNDLSFHEHHGRPRTEDGATCKQQITETCA
jgi:hypothetical protein